MRTVTIASVLVFWSGACAHPANSPAQSASAAAAPADQIGATGGAVFVGCGYLLIENHERTSFSLILKADQVRHVPNKEMDLYTLDNVLVEAKRATAQEIGMPELRGIELLASHQSWELAHISKVRGWPQIVPTQSSPVPFNLPGIHVMAWIFEAPTPFDVLGQTVHQVAFMTAAVDDVVMVLAAPLRDGNDERVAARVLGQSMRTVKRTPTPLDVLDVSRRLKSTQDQWPDCSPVQ